MSDPGAAHDGDGPAEPTRRRVLSAGGLFVAGAAVGAATSPEPSAPLPSTTTLEVTPGGRDDTDALQRALDEHATVSLASGHFAVRSVRLRSGNRLVMTPSTVLHAIALHDGDVPAVVLIDSVEDVEVDGGTIDGANGPVTLGVGIYGAKRVRIRNTRCIRIATTADGQKGDGFYIARSYPSGHKEMAEDIVLDGVTADGNGRQGLSVIAVRGLRVVSSSFVNTTTAVPGAGVDFEPNKDADTIDDVVISGCTFAANQVGVLFYMKNLEHLADVTITDCTFRDNRASGLYGDLGGADHLTVRGCTFTGNREHGIFVAKCASVSVIDCTIRDHEGGFGIEVDNVARSVIRGNSVRGGGMAGIVVGALEDGPRCRTLVQGNQVWDNTGAAMRLVSRGSGLDAIVDGNWIGNTDGDRPQTEGVATEGGAVAHLSNNQVVGHPETTT